MDFSRSLLQGLTAFMINATSITNLLFLHSVKFRKRCLAVKKPISLRVIYFFPQCLKPRLFFAGIKDRLPQSIERSAVHSFRTFHYVGFVRIGEIKLARCSFRSQLGLSLRIRYVAALVRQVIAVTAREAVL
jgi:hypothetical protein